MTLRFIRRTLATLFFIGVTLLFLDFTGTLHSYLGWMARVQLLPAMMALNLGVVIGLVVLTLIFGRIYCSVVCPLGVMQDGLAWLGRRAKPGRYTYSPERRWLRYPVLVLFVAAIAMGFLGVADLIAPYSSFGRIAQNLFQPVYICGNNILAAIAEHFDSYAFYHRDVWVRSGVTMAIAALTFAVLAVLAWRGGRTYCNTICPVGTVLGLLSRFSFLRIYFDGSKCRQCSRCTRHCKASCIDFRTMKVDGSRCVVCGDCLGQCEFGGLHYGHPSALVKQATEERRRQLRERAEARERRRQEAAQTAEAAKQAGQTAAAPQDGAPADGADPTRRGFLLAMAMATTAAALAQTKKKVDGGLAAIEDKRVPHRTTPIVPPGALSIRNLTHHCTACQLCVAECPNDVLRPSTDADHFMQPVMSYERGFCRPECTRCSEVCPTGAIRPIRPEDKVSTHIGHAVYSHFNCVVLRDGVTCGNCSRHCPTGAITMIDFDGPDGTVQIPSVNESRCIGCGACEYVCPARPLSAIVVEGHEVHRVE